MSYKNIHKDRLKFLITFGIEPQHIQNFISRNRKELIANGCKLGNVPKELPKKINVILTLPERANKIFEEWINDVVGKFHFDFTVEELIDLFRKNEETDLDWSKDFVADLSRATLQNIIKESCPEELLEFLKQPIRKKTTTEDSSKSISHFREDSSVSALGMLVPLLLTESDITHDKIPQDVKILKSVIALKAGRLAEAEKWCLSIDNAAGLRDKILEALENEKNKAYEGVLAGNGIECHEVIFEDTYQLEPEAVDIFGYCYNVIPDKLGQSVHFIHAVGIVKEGSLFELPDDVRISLFPDRGNLIGYSKSLRFKLPLKDDFGVWRVKLRESDKDIKYVIHEKAADVHDVVLVPYASSEHDKVRHFLQTCEGIHSKCIFWLEDDILIKPGGALSDSRKIDFNRPLDAWNHLKGICWRDKFFVLGDLPTPDFHYDCCDLAGVITKLLKAQAKIKGWPVLTTVQIKEFAQFIDSGEFWALPKQIERVKEGLLSFATLDENLSEIVDILLKRPEIVQAIEQAKSDAIRSAVEEQVKLRSTIELLNNEKIRIEKLIETRTAELKQVPSKIQNNIRKAFEEARSNGEKLLGEVTLFQALLNSVSSNVHTVKPEARLEVLNAFCVKGNSGLPLEKAIALSGLSKSSVRKISAALPILVSNGFTPIFKGSSAALVSEECCKAITGNSCAIFDVPVGSTLKLSLDELLERHPSVDTILIRNFNLSPVENYAPNLNVIAYRRLLCLETTEKVDFYLTLSSHDFAFDIAPDFAWNCAVIDLDHDVKSDISTDFDLEKAAEEFLEDKKAKNRPWLNAIIRIEDALASLESEDCTGARAVIADALFR